MVSLVAFQKDGLVKAFPCIYRANSNTCFFYFLQFFCYKARVSIWVIRPVTRLAERSDLIGHQGGVAARHCLLPPPPLSQNSTSRSLLLAANRDPCSPSHTSFCHTMPFCQEKEARSCLSQLRRWHHQEHEHHS